MEFISETFDEGLLSLPSVTLIGMYNNDNYFTAKDLEYYKKKYAKEKTLHKESTKIRQQ